MVSADVKKFMDESLRSQATEVERRFDKQREDFYSRIASTEKNLQDQFTAKFDSLSGKLDQMFALMNRSSSPPRVSGVSIPLPSPSLGPPISSPISAFPPVASHPSHPYSAGPSFIGASGMSATVTGSVGVPTTITGVPCQFGNYSAPPPVYTDSTLPPFVPHYQPPVLSSSATTFPLSLYYVPSSYPVGTSMPSYSFPVPPTGDSFVNGPPRGSIGFSLNDVNQKKGMGKFAVDESVGISTPIIDGQFKCRGRTNMFQGWGKLRRRQQRKRIGFGRSVREKWKQRSVPLVPRKQREENKEGKVKLAMVMYHRVWRVGRINAFGFLWNFKIRKETSKVVALSYLAGFLQEFKCSVPFDPGGLWKHRELSGLQHHPQEDFVGYEAEFLLKESSMPVAQEGLIPANDDGGLEKRIMTLRKEGEESDFKEFKERIMDFQKEKEGKLTNGVICNFSFLHWIIREELQNYIFDPGADKAIKIWSFVIAGSFLLLFWRGSLRVWGSNCD